MKRIIPILLWLTFNLTTQNWCWGKSLNPREPEPVFAQVLAAFYAEQDLSALDTSALKRRLKKSAAFPALSFGYDQQLRNTESLAVTDNISVSGGRVTIGPEDNNLNLWNNLGRNFHVRAVWKLGDLVFNRGELDLIRLEREHIKLRQYFAGQLYGIFEARALCRASYWQKPDGKRAMGYRAKFNALTEELDALTGGRFHQNWRKL